jgi:hypothetical protein
VTTTHTDEYDAPWKEALEVYFEAFIAFFLPQAHAAIDWTQPVIFQDKELQKLIREADQGTRTVDKLVQVQRKNGRDAWVLIHIEVQSQEEYTFAERMFTYHARLRDRYRKRVVSIAVLGDEKVGWKPARFADDLWECSIEFRDPVVKLLEYRTQWEALEASDNPFATLVMAHLQTQATRHHHDERRLWKLHLLRRLYERGYQPDDIYQLFRFIDWLMWLPDEVKELFEADLHALEQEQHMPYVTSIERSAEERGIQQGIQEERVTLVLRLLTRRCGVLAPETETRIRQLALGQLAELAEALLDFSGADDLHAWLQALPPAE